MSFPLNFVTTYENLISQPNNYFSIDVSLSICLCVGTLSSIPAQVNPKFSLTKIVELVSIKKDKHA